MTHRNRKLLDLPHRSPCFASFKHNCAQPTEPTGFGVCIPAHDNSLKGGRGHGHKTPDHRHACVCPEAHDFIDGRKGGWSLDEKRNEWEIAHIATWDYYWTSGKVKVS